MPRRAPRYRRKPANQAWWKITHPDGAEETVLDLARWCRHHDLAYKPFWFSNGTNGYKAEKVDRPLDTKRS